MRRFYVQRHEGQAVVLAALAFIVLVGALGLALDGANAYNQRRNANNAADAAAMAGTRELLTANENGGTNSDVYQAVETYLDTHLPASSGTLTWNAYYIDRNGNQLGSAIANNSSAVETIDMGDTTKVRGIAVNIQFTFKTFFMPLLGRDTLTVSGYGLGLIGPLGGATGPALIPLAISDTAARDWQTSGDTTNSWSMGVYTSTTGLTSRAIDQTDLRLIALDTSGSTPSTGSSGDCSSGTPVNSLIYWWCKGTAYNIETTPDELNSHSMPPPSSSSLKNAISTNRIGDDVLMPVYNLLDLSTGKVKIVGFIAVHLTSYQSSGTYKGVLKGKLIGYYTAPGPISGDSSGFFDTYAINLVR
jgi:Flp pilus assembly protein TadG